MEALLWTSEYVETACSKWHGLGEKKSSLLNLLQNDLLDSIQDGVEHPTIDLTDASLVLSLAKKVIQKIRSSW